MMKTLGIKNILITGGSGKIGTATIPQLLKAGFKLRAVQLPDEPVEVEGLHVLLGRVELDLDPVALRFRGRAGSLHGPLP